MHAGRVVAGCILTQFHHIDSEGLNNSSSSSSMVVASSSLRSRKKTESPSRPTSPTKLQSTATSDVSVFNEQDEEEEDNEEEHIDELKDESSSTLTIGTTAISQASLRAKSAGNQKSQNFVKLQTAVQTTILENKLKNAQESPKNLFELVRALRSNKERADEIVDERGILKQAFVSKISRNYMDFPSSRISDKNILSKSTVRFLKKLIKDEFEEQQPSTESAVKSVLKLTLTGSEEDQIYADTNVYNMQHQQGDAYGLEATSSKPIMDAGAPITNAASSPSNLMAKILRRKGSVVSTMTLNSSMIATAATEGSHVEGAGGSIIARNGTAPTLDVAGAAKAVIAAAEPKKEFLSSIMVDDEQLNNGLSDDDEDSGATKNGIPSSRKINSEGSDSKSLVDGFTTSTGIPSELRNEIAAIKKKLAAQMPVSQQNNTSKFSLAHFVLLSKVKWGMGVRQWQPFSALDPIRP